MKEQAEPNKIQDENQLKRTLKPRHMNMIAIGGAIGTGLFVASGASISEAGPGGAILAYAIIGISIYFVMNALGEMATHLPVSGAFETYGSKYVDPSFGFAMGWNYWYCCAVTLAVELVAGSILIKFWFPNSNSAAWSALFLAIILVLNLFSAKIFGESEFWFAGIKVVVTVIFLIVGVLMILGVMNGDPVGFQNWTKGDAPFVGGLFGTLGIFMVAGFSFVGVEVVAISAGECENPKKDVPKAVNSVFWRILIFYIGAIIVIGTIIPYTDPNLLNASIENVSISPFTLVFERAGMAFAAAFVNAVILTSVLSCGNSTLYIAGRLLYSMGREGKGPKFLGKVSKNGVPVYAILITACVASLCFLTSLAPDAAVYTWLYNATGLVGFISWFGISFTHLRFRRGFKAQGKSLDDLSFKAKFFPYGTLFALFIFAIVIVGQGYFAISKGGVDWYGMVVAYIGLPIFILLYVGHKFSKKTKIVPLKEMDLSGTIE